VSANGIVAASMMGTITEIMGALYGVRDRTSTRTPARGMQTVGSSSTEGAMKHRAHNLQGKQTIVRTGATYGAVMGFIAGTALPIIGNLVGLVIGAGTGALAGMIARSRRHHATPLHPET